MFQTKFVNFRPAVNLPWNYVTCLTNFGLDWFSRSDAYWIQTA